MFGIYDRFNFSIKRFDLHNFSSLANLLKTAAQHGNVQSPRLRRRLHCSTAHHGNIVNMFSDPCFMASPAVKLYADQFAIEMFLDYGLKFMTVYVHLCQILFFIYAIMSW